MTAKQEIAQNKSIKLLRDLKQKEMKIEDLQFDLDKALVKTSEARHKKQRYKHEAQNLSKLCEELTENLRDAERLHEKHMEIIGQFELENRERTKGAATMNPLDRPGSQTGIADAVKNLQRAVSMKIQNVLRKSTILPPSRDLKKSISADEIPLQRSLSIGEGKKDKPN